MTVHAKPDRKTYTPIKWEPYTGETILDNIAELEENYYGVDNRTLH